MIQTIKSHISQNVTNFPGWRTDRKIVVLESDDWGSIRMSSRKNLMSLSKTGIAVKKCHYLQYDALASEDDLTLLFELLRSHKGYDNRSPVITANVIMSNPDFEKIKAADFRNYHYEIFPKTLDKYPAHKNSFKLWQDGIKEGIFHPQFHGREHLQVLRWLSQLKDPNSETRRAFDAGVFGVSTTATSENRKSYLASYDWSDLASRDFILKSIAEGLFLFKSLFGFESLSSIAPNYVWHKDVERVYEEHGIRYIQGSYVQNSPQIGVNRSQKIRHFTGQRNDMGQVYLVRNCRFEPSSNTDIDWIELCLKDIRNAFFWKKPAIIGMHRVNFVGFINPENRDRNIEKFDQLLRRIIQIWPEVEFMTSDQLGQLIENYG